MNIFFSDIIEEEEAFQAYAEQRRYASTLGRTCSGNGNNTGAQHCRREAADGEKIRNLKGNISRLVSTPPRPSEIKLEHIGEAIFDIPFMIQSHSGSPLGSTS